MRHALVVAMVAAGVAGCGFHLQGKTPLPASVERLRVVHDQPYGVAAPPLVLALERRLRARGALADGDADAVLRIRELETQRRLLAVSPSDARGAVYELETTVRFDFRVGGEPRLTRRSLSVRREYSFDDTTRLAAEAEREDLKQTMQTELADLILLQLESVDDAR